MPAGWRGGALLDHPTPGRLLWWAYRPPEGNGWPDTTPPFFPAGKEEVDRATGVLGRSQDPVSAQHPHCA